MTATEIPFTALFLEPDSAPLPPHKYTPSHSAPTERFPSPKPTRTPPSRFACSSLTKSRRSGPARSTRSPTAPSPFAACSAPETTHCPPTPLPTGSGSPAPGTPLTVSSTPPSPVWFRDHAAYCGMAMTAQGGLLAIFAQLGARPDRRPVTNRPWPLPNHSIPVWHPARGQHLPMCVTLKPPAARPPPTTWSEPPPSSKRAKKPR